MANVALTQKETGTPGRTSILVACVLAFLSLSESWASVLFFSRSGVDLGFTLLLAFWIFPGFAAFFRWPIPLNISKKLVAVNFWLAVLIAIVIANKKVWIFSVSTGAGVWLYLLASGLLWFGVDRYSQVSFGDKTKVNDFDRLSEKEGAVQMFGIGRMMKTAFNRITGSNNEVKPLQTLPPTKGDFATVEHVENVVAQSAEKTESALAKIAKDLDAKGERISHLEEKIARLDAEVSMAKSKMATLRYGMFITGALVLGILVFLLTQESYGGRYL